MALQGTMTHQYSSIIRGHHVYKDTRTPYIGEELMLDCEHTNQFDRHAVAVMKRGEIVGHMPRAIAKLSWFFLKRGDTIEAVVTGKRKKGLRLEVPCDFIYSGPQRMIKQLEKLLSQMEN